MITDATCTIIGDSVADCFVPNIMDDKQLIPHVTYEGDSVTIGEETIISDVTSCNFKTPVKLRVYSGEDTKEYTVYVHAFTGLPVLWIETEGRTDITSKEEYLQAHFKLTEDVVTRAAGDVTEVDGQIKGRGNSTWSMPKKPYRIKLAEKKSLLGEPADKSWVLLANYSDKTALRTATAFYMGAISNLDYTPRFHFVEVMLNGRYQGNYQLGEHIKIANHRVNVGDDGFLIEIDSRAPDNPNSRYFIIPHIPWPVNIKSPDVAYDDENFNYIKEYLREADKTLFSSNFTDPDEGWQKYLDMDSFVDWYLINEITKNNDACFFSSCYMHLKRGDKIKMGPLWDYDISLGNINYNDNFNTDGFWIKDVEWYARLFKDPAFLDKVKERFAYFYSHQDDIMKDINENARYLRYSVQENENRWHTLYTYSWPNYDIWGSYANEVQCLKTWIAKRFEWLKNEYDSM